MAYVMNVVKSEGKSNCSFLRNGGSYYENGVVLSKVPQTTKLFEFILDILSTPRYSWLISWEGTDGEFAIKRPNQVACLWGERNGRPNMTYQKFSRALRYYYHKKVLSKVPGRNCVYKFDFEEIQKQYGYSINIPSATTKESNAGNRHYEIPATCDPIQNPLDTEYYFPASTELTMCGHSQRPIITNASVTATVFSVRSPVMVCMVPHQTQVLTHSPSCPNARYFAFN